MAADEDRSKKMIRNSLDAEVERLTLQHSVVKDTMGGKLLFAPLDLTKPGLRILDSACADGLWLRELALTVPSSVSATNKYIATDINPAYFPTTSSPITYQKQSFNEPWPADWAGNFDLVHQRFALAAAGPNPMQPIIHNFVNLVAPGGYIELVEIEFGGEGVGEGMDLVFALMMDIFKVMKRDHRFTFEMKDMLKNEGLVDVNEEVVVVNVGGNLDGLSDAEKEFRTRAVTSMKMTAEGLSQGAKNMPPMTYTHDQLDQLPEKVEAALKKSGGLWRIHVVWGKKP